MSTEKLKKNHVGLKSLLVFIVIVCLISLYFIGQSSNEKINKYKQTERQKEETVNSSVIETPEIAVEVETNEATIIVEE